MAVMDIPTSMSIVVASILYFARMTPVEGILGKPPKKVILSI
jgi:hypothetical protein